MSACPELERCIDRRTLDAEHRGNVIAKLESIDSSIKALWAEMKDNRSDFKSLYFKIGMISGGTSLVISLISSMVFKMMTKP